MSYTIRTILLASALCAALVTSAFSVTASADMKEACDNGQFSGDAKTACEGGYNGKACSTFAPFTAACEAGVQQAQKDGVTPGGGTTTPPAKEGANKCGGAKTEIVSCDEKAGLGAIASLIKTAIMVVTILIGLVAVGGITYAAIIYASARDNQSQVQEALTIIRNVVIGIVLYGFSVAIINWLIPGGVIG